MSSFITHALKIRAMAAPQRFHEHKGLPSQLRCLGTDPAELVRYPSVAIVGSRKVSPYGKQVTYMFASQLAARGVTIISGLALGVDTIAHQAALDVQGRTMAVLAGGLDYVYPPSNRPLAGRMLAAGGSIVSEYAEGTPHLKQHFVARNRIVAGLADVVLITEASIQSGARHTFRYAGDYGRTAFAIPGNITSPSSAGTNQMIQDGALVAATVDDVLAQLGLADQPAYMRQRTVGANAGEQAIIDRLEQGISDAAELITATGLAVETFYHHLTMLELAGKIRSLGANRWTLN